MAAQNEKGVRAKWRQQSISDTSATNLCSANANGGCYCSCIFLYLLSLFFYPLALLASGMNTCASLLCAHLKRGRSIGITVTQKAEPCTFSSLRLTNVVSQARWSILFTLRIKKNLYFFKKHFFGLRTACEVRADKPSQPSRNN